MLASSVFRKSGVMSRARARALSLSPLPDPPSHALALAPLFLSSPLDLDADLDARDEEEETCHMRRTKDDSACRVGGSSLRLHYNWVIVNLGCIIIG